MWEKQISKQKTKSINDTALVVIFQGNNTSDNNT